MDDGRIRGGHSLLAHDDDAWKISSIIHVISQFCFPMAPDVYLHSGPIHKSLSPFLKRLNNWTIESKKLFSREYKKREREIQKKYEKSPINDFEKKKRKSDDDRIKDWTDWKKNLMSDEVK